MAKVKENQKELNEFVKEIESVSPISSHYSDTVKQSGQVINREVYVYNDCSYRDRSEFCVNIQ